MKKNLARLSVVILIPVFLYCCGKTGIIKNNFDFAAEQLMSAIAETEEITSSYSPEEVENLMLKGKLPPVSPRTIDRNGNLELVSSRDWTSGFFRASYGICMNTPATRYGRRPRENILQISSGKKAMAVPMTWALKSFAALATATV